MRGAFGWTQQEMADRLGLSVRGWQKIERDEGLPNGETLLAFKAIGINPGWILTGVGPKEFEDAAAALVQKHVKAGGYTSGAGRGVDVVLLQRLGDAVEAIFIECKQTAPKRAIMAEAAGMYNELLDSVNRLDDDAIVDATIAVLKRRLKERLSTAEAGTGKRSAS